MSYSVDVKAQTVIDNKNGTFTIVLPDRPMSDEEHKVIDKLVPDLKDQFYALLDKQALLLSIATPQEVKAEPKPPEGKDKKKGKPIPPRPEWLDSQKASQKPEWTEEEILKREG